MDYLPKDQRIVPCGLRSSTHFYDTTRLRSPARFVPCWRTQPPGNEFDHTKHDTMKKPSWSNAILLAIIIVAAAHGQAQRGPAVPQMRGDGPSPPAKPFSITRSDPGLDNIISPGTKLVELGRGFGLTEA